MGGVQFFLLYLVLFPIQAFIPSNYRFLNQTSLEVSSGSFQYRLNFFDTVQQYENNQWLANIGTFDRFIEPNQFLLERGTYCGAIQSDRSGIMNLYCDASINLQASEPAICVYHFHLYHPSLCEQNALYEGKLRLVGNTTAGRLEIYHDRQWGTICDDYWNDASAQVACRQLGFETGRAFGSAYFGQGIDPIWLDDVQCLGNETFIMDCPHLPWGSHNCNHGEDAGISCWMSPPPPPPNPPPSPPPPSPPPPSPPPPSPPPPSPLPPSPPPPSPPPPSPPPPLPMLLSPEAIQAVTETVGTTVTTAVATSVASSVSSSVGASTAGSTSVPSANPAGIVSMISVLQTMDMKQNLQIGEMPQTFQGLTGSVPWINLDFNILPESSNGRRLLMLEESPQVKKGIQLLILYLSWLAIFVPIHYKIHQSKTLPGIVGFPQLEFTLMMVFTNPLTKCAGALFSTQKVEAIFFGIGLLCLLPIPLIVYSIYIIRKLITHTRKIKFITFQPIHTYTRWYQLIPRGFLSSNQGHWRCKDKTLDKYGLFFNTIRGPIHVLKDPKHMVRWDPLQQRYKYNSWIVYPEVFQWIRTYYKPYLLSKNLWVVLFLQAFHFSPHGNAAQIIFLIFFYGIHLSILFILAPFNTRKDQITEVLTSMCELGTYLCGILILMARRGVIEMDLTFLEQGLFALQTGSIAVQILSQMSIILVMMGMVVTMIQNKYFMDRKIKKNRHHYLLKKYANRWLFKVYGRWIGQPKQISHIKIHPSMKYLM